MDALGALVCGLIHHGFQRVESPESADIIILGTCTVIETTERHMISRMHALQQYGKKLIVTGCMASAQVEIIREHAPDAIILPPERYRDILKILKISQKPLYFVPEVNDVIAAIPIANGCTGTCSYCITRIARGKLRSREPDEIRRSVMHCVAQGAREIRLTAQDTAAYGMDIHTSLPECIRKVTSIPGSFMVRVGMMNPRTAFPILSELINAFSHKKVFKFIHLPVQSGSNRILLEMKRGYDMHTFYKIVSAFRRKFRKCTLSTDIIVGYPTETDEDFEESVKLVANIKPDIINVTRFSPRKGTPAFKLKPLPQRIVKERSRILVEMRFHISRENLEKRIGKTERVLVCEKGKKHTMIGRTMDYKPVIIEEPVKLGNILDVEIVGATDIFLIGKSL